MEIALSREIVQNKASARILGISAFVILTSLGAFVRIPLPFSPVPLTLQTLFILLGAAVFKKNLGVLVGLSYVCLGAAGLPIFSGAGSGLLYLAGPTAGYLWGFIFAALFISHALGRAKNRFSVFLVFLTGDFLILGSGAFWLRIFLKCSFEQALAMGVVPFLAGDLIKVGVAVAVYRKIKIRCKELF